MIDIILVNGSSEYSEYSEILAEDEKISIETYGGYYIARYESGITGYTGMSGSNLEAVGTRYVGGNIIIQKGYEVWNFIRIGKAIEEAEGLYNKAEDNVQSKLCSSFAWDTVLKFIETEFEGYATDSVQGNYKETEFQYIDLDNQKKIKRNGTSELVPTGQTTAVKNIYDLGGNVFEWTTEKKGDSYTDRGGSRIYSSTYAAGFRRGMSTTQAAADIGFRVALFL